MHCPNCGNLNTDGSIFCGSCGNKLPPSQNTLPKISLWLVLLYMAISFGFSVPVWFLMRRKALSEMQSPVKLGRGWLLFSLVLNFINILGSIGYMALTLINEGIPDMNALSWYLGGSIAGMFMAIILVVEAYKMRRILDDHYNGHLKQGIEFSGNWTLIGNILYLQHKINKL